MKRYTHLLFDLDGTLTDPAEGITNSVRYALAQLGIQENDYRKLCLCIGPPLKLAFREFWGIEGSRFDLALAQYRVYFQDRGIFENHVYAGIPELLQALQSDGRSLWVATSKPDVFARQILERFGLMPYFSGIAGNTLSEARPGKAEVISWLMSQHPEITPENTLMIGDRKYDVEGAAACGLDCAAVLYGYGSPEELNAAGPTFLAQSPYALRDILLDDMER